MALTGVPDDEATAWEELLFTLHDRDHPTVVFMECDSLPRQTELETQLQQDLPEYQHHRIDLTPYPVTSLLRALAERLPHDVRHSPRVRYVVHIHGLENSLIVTEDGELKHSLLTAQLNLERELLFRNVPYILVVWSDGVFFRKLQREAPDLWDWVTVKHRFSDPVARPIIDPTLLLASLQPASIAEHASNNNRIWELKKESKKVDRELRSAQLKKAPRLLKRKVNLLISLTTELKEAGRYKEAENIGREAIRLQEKLEAEPEQIGHGWLVMGILCLYQQHLADALQAFEQGKKYLNDTSQGNTHYLINYAYSLKGEWEPAISSLQTALLLYQENGKADEVSETLDVLGLSYSVQNQHHMALETYREAIRWQKAHNYTRDLFKTYQQVAKVYTAQERYPEAFYWYQQALTLLPESAQAQREETQERIAHLQAQAAENSAEADRLSGAP